MTNHHSVHRKQVMSQTRISIQNHHPADQEVAHPQGEAEEEEEGEEEGGGEAEGGEEAVDQEVQVV